jgi:hypothetical protein
VRDNFILKSTGIEFIYLYLHRFQQCLLVISRHLLDIRFEVLQRGILLGGVNHLSLKVVKPMERVIESDINLTIMVDNLEEVNRFLQILLFFSIVLGFCRYSKSEPNATR